MSLAKTTSMPDEYARQLRAEAGRRLLAGLVIDSIWLLLNLHIAVAAWLTVLHVTSVPDLSVVLPFAILLPALMGCLESRFGQARRRVAWLMDDPAPVEQIPVALSLRREGVLIGGDEGVLSFVNGWMTFEGLRIRFALSGGDIETTATGSVRFRKLPLRLEFEHLDGLRPNGQLQYRVAQFAKTPGIWTMGQSILPPVTPTPEVLERAHLEERWRRRLLVASMVLAGVSLPALPCMEVATVVPFAVALFLSSVMGLACGMRHRALVRDNRTRQRLVTLS